MTRSLIATEAEARAAVRGELRLIVRPIPIDDAPILRDPGKHRSGIPTDAQNVRNLGPYLKCDAPPGSITVSCRVDAPWMVDDVVAVKEGWADTNGESGPMLSYRAGGPPRFLTDESYPVDYARYPGCSSAMWEGDLLRGAPGHRWRSPATMPTWAIRSHVRIVRVEVRRVQTITVDEIIAAGHVIPDVDYSVPDHPDHLDRERAEYARDQFRSDFDRRFAKRARGWDASPWVWMVRCEGARTECAAPAESEVPRG